MKTTYVPPAQRADDGRRRDAVYVALEGGRPWAGAARYALEGVSELVVRRGPQRSFTREGDRATLELPDRRVSSRHLAFVRDGSGFVVSDLGSSNGTRIEGEACREARVDGTARILVGSTALVLSLDEIVDPEDDVPAVLESSAMARLPVAMRSVVPATRLALRTTERLAQAPLPILLFGETGTGKEVLARAIHDRSGRPGRYVAVNCAALTASLFESQLFGHTRGAFSGAVRDEPGLFREADQGTLLLDEIGELPASAQAGLLRVLQEREVLPVGASRPVPVDVRVIAATLKPIGTSTDFRTDLYARVAAHVHALAPVRERIADLGVFVAQVLERTLSADRARTLQLAPDVVERFALHAWPMNVRELENVLAVAVQIAGEATDEIPMRAVTHAFVAPMEASSSSSAPPRRSRPARSGPVTLSDDERARRDALAAKLKETGGNVTHTAQALGTTRTQVHRYMRRFGLDAKTFRSGT